MPGLFAAKKLKKNRQNFKWKGLINSVEDVFFLKLEEL